MFASDADRPRQGRSISVLSSSAAAAAAGDGNCNTTPWLDCGHGSVRWHVRATAWHEYDCVLHVGTAHRFPFTLITPELSTVKLNVRLYKLRRVAMRQTSCNHVVINHWQKLCHSTNIRNIPLIFSVNNSVNRLFKDTNYIKLIEEHGELTS